MEDVRSSWQNRLEYHLRFFMPILIVVVIVACALVGAAIAALIYRSN